jgi:aldose 1-epimerase
MDGSGGDEAEMFVLESAAGMSARLTGHGATLMALEVPDRRGRPTDVVLGFDAPARYRGDHPCFGATVGRVANRIACACFTLDGAEYALAKNDGPNALHGGPCGFDKRDWEASDGDGPEGAWVRFLRTSPAGEEGYPGTLQASVTYRVTPARELVIEMRATTDRPTIVNLAHHSYWNLSGHASGDVLGHELQLFCELHTPSGASRVPTGTIERVAGTAYDFTRPKRIERALAEMGGDPPGCDVNFVVSGEAGVLRPVARLEDPVSGIVMELSSTEPGVQLYTANHLDGTLRGKGGAAYARHAGLCLETQKYPDAIHHPEWPSPVLRPGEVYSHVMVHRFSTR